MCLIYQINGKITGNQIEKMRELVGWKPLVGLYDKALKNALAYIVCYDSYTPVGFINIVTNNSTDAYIQDLIVLNEYQSKGIGTHLVNMAIEYVQQQRIPTLSIVFDKSLIDFYKKFNFKIQYSGRIQLNSER